MDRVEEIEAAITSLPQEEYRRLVEWFRAREQTRWDDEQMKQISSPESWIPIQIDSESEQELVRDWRSWK